MLNRRLRHWLALLGSLLLAGCAWSGLSSCPAGFAPARTVEMAFGRDIGGTFAVSDEDWAGFVEREIAPRFASGFTVIDANGAWRTASGAIVREPTKLLLLVLPGETGLDPRIAAIEAAYKAQFKQESVLVMIRRNCVSF